jgi:hypothetical protein
MCIVADDLASPHLTATMHCLGIGQSLAEYPTYALREVSHYWCIVLPWLPGTTEAVNIKLWQLSWADFVISVSRLCTDL